MADLKLNNVTKVFGENTTAVKDVFLEVDDGEMVVLVGPSGCGKSTTLRLVAGLEEVTEGTIQIGGVDVTDLSPSQRSVAMAFQDYALYPRMSAYENIEYGLKHSTSLSETDRKKKVHETAEMLDIMELLEKTPSNLSGGQQQRVALGRAIVREPDIFLLDEPLSNLDARLRSRMRTELQNIQKKLGITTLYVTHDQKEAMTMGDRIVVMQDGEFQQISEPEYAYDSPENKFVATFLGNPAMNILNADVNQTGNRILLRHNDVTISEHSAVNGFPEVELGIRPEDIQVTEGTDDSEFTASVLTTEYQGKENYIHLSLDGEVLTARSPTDVHPAEGDTVNISMNFEDIYIFDQNSGSTLKSRGQGWEDISVLKDEMEDIAVSKKGLD